MDQENRYQPPKAEVADMASTDADEMASRGARLGGALIDALLASAVLFPFMFYSGIWRQAMATGGYEFGAKLELGLVALVAFLVLHAYLLHNHGQTIGKRLVGTRIVAFGDNRILPLWKIFVLRYLTTSVAGQIPFVGGLYGLVDALFVFRADKRCIHDLIAGTKVINATAPWKGHVDINNAG